ncbi:hypothetical protein B0T10DRAFT_548925 [Thelonectria olida]|uniref:NACHT domain-containing protein n=1 Tax=Thelonectria olida TaxID=1576542 RepID=A0A9P9ALA1_9HYPO|nr:hypothetical protein B0T10DRAFT_548925 [Thelonectria olida]
MAETFSLVAGILQVVDFGTKYVSTAHKLYKSGSDGVQSLADLQAFSNNLQAVLDTLRKHSQNDGGISESPDERALAKACAATLSEMLDTLRSIKIPSKGRKREAVVAATKVLWRKDKIDALQDRLNHYNQQLTLNLVLSLRMHATTSLQNQQQILDHLAARNNATTYGISLSKHGFGSAVIEHITRPLQESSRADRRLHLRQELINAVYDVERDGKASSKIYMSESHRDRLYDVYLASLSYPGIQDRELQISKAHQETFRWVFDDEKNDAANWSSIKDWLASDEQVYWITGKAGAGKSTLMKFITQPAETSRASADDEAHDEEEEEARCAKYLRNRTQEKPFTLASFYFWAAGSVEQKSTLGLFLTILAQLLRAHPEAIPFVSPSAWEALSLFNETPETFSLEEGQAMFHRAVMHIDSFTTPVLFIDGLDEFDGDHEGLISLLQSLVSKSSVKICVSSRPWVEFEKAFEHKPSLRLEDLTYSDIKNYIVSRFFADVSFQNLQQRDTSLTTALIEEVIVKASGVFLWVQLVVSSLLTGIRFGDRVIDLKRRLDLLPPDLEQLYERMLDSLDPFYRKHASEYFMIMKTSPEPPLALLLSFADEEDPVKFALGMENPIMTAEQIANRVNDIRLRVNSRCKGLLEMDRIAQRLDKPTLGTSRLRVRYLHKTVKDYIERAETQKRLERVSDDTHRKLLAATLATFKCIPIDESNDHDSRPPNIYLSPDPTLKEVTRLLLPNEAYLEIALNAVISNLMYHAARVRPEYALDVINLLDGFFKAVMSSHGHLPVPSRTYRLRPITGFERESMTHEDRLLCHAANFGVYEYVSAKAKKGCIIKGIPHSQARAVNRGLARLAPKLARLSPRLSFSITCDTYPLLLAPIEFSTPFDSFTIKTVETILGKGGNPNYPIYFADDPRSVKFASVWTVLIAVIVLAFAHQSPTSGNREILGKLSQLMISSGAVVSEATVADGIRCLIGRVVPIRVGVPNLRDGLENIPYKVAVKKAIYCALKRLKQDQGHSTLEIELEYMIN